MEVAELVISGSTLALAGATVYLAVKTRAVAERTAEEAEAVREQVNVANEQVHVSVRALQAGVRPWLTADESHTASIDQDDPQLGWDIAEPDVIRAEVWLKNVGAGLALLAPDSIEIYSEGHGGEKGDVRRTGRASAPVIAPGQTTTLSFRIGTRGSPDLSLESFAGQDRHSGAFWIRVAYTDAEGDQRTTVEARVVKPQDAQDWIIHQIKYFAADAQDPFAVARFLRTVSAGLVQ